MTIKLRLGIFEDEISQDIVAANSLGRAYATPELLSYWQGAIDRLQATPRFAAPDLNDEAASIDAVRPDGIEILLCSRSSLDAFNEATNALGMHIVHTLDGDPFGDGTALSTAHRVLVVSDRQEFIDLTADLAKEDDDPEDNLAEYLVSYLNTFFHEIAHALVFVENSALLSPAQIDDLFAAGEIGHDIFDCITNYGIRPVEIDGEEIWAEDADEAFDLIEDHVEQLGKTLLFSALKDEQGIFRFPAAMAAEEEIDRIVSKTATAAS